MKPNKKTETLYTCPSNRVSVVRTNCGLRRWPQHDYQCVLFVLNPQDGTRVCYRPDGRVEFMPNFDELKNMLSAIDPALGDLLPATFRNKPVQSQQHFARLNAIRHAHKGKRE